MSDKGNWSAEDSAALERGLKNLQLFKDLEESVSDIKSDQKKVLARMTMELGGIDEQTGAPIKGEIRKALDKNKEEILTEVKKITKVLHGNGEKGLVHKLTDANQEIGYLKEKFKKQEQREEERRKESRKERRGLTYTIIGGIIMFLLQAIITYIMYGPKG